MRMIKVLVSMLLVLIVAVGPVPTKALGVNGSLALVYGGVYAPCDPETSSSLPVAGPCLWSDDHQTYVRWFSCYQTPYGPVQSVGTSGVMGGGIPCSYEPSIEPESWCPEGMQEAPNQWGGRGCEPWE